MAINFNPSINQHKNSSFRIKSPKLAKTAAKTMIALSTLTGLGTISSCSHDDSYIPEAKTETVLDRFTKGMNALGVVNANQYQDFDSVKMIDDGDTMVLKVVPEETTPTNLVIETDQQVNNKMVSISKSNITGLKNGLLMKGAYRTIDNNSTTYGDAIGTLSNDTVKVYETASNELVNMFAKGIPGQTVKSIPADPKIEGIVYKILKTAVRAK